MARRSRSSQHHGSRVGGDQLGPRHLFEGESEEIRGVEKQVDEDYHGEPTHKGLGKGPFRIPDLSGNIGGVGPSVVSPKDRDESHAEAAPSGRLEANRIPESACARVGEEEDDCRQAHQSQDLGKGGDVLDGRPPGEGPVVGASHQEDRRNRHPSELTLR